MNKQLNELLKLMPHAVTAPEYEKAGNTWRPNLHVTATTDDRISWDTTRLTLEKYGEHAKAYFVGGDFFVSFEIQFAEHGNDAVRFWNSEVARLEKEEKRAKRKRA